MEPEHHKAGEEQLFDNKFKHQGTASIRKKLINC